MRKEESHTRWKRTRTRNAGIIYNKGSEWKGRVSVVVLLRLQWALIVRLVLRVNWWQVLEEVEVSSVC